MKSLPTRIEAAEHIAAPLRERFEPPAAKQAWAKYQAASAMLHKNCWPHEDGDALLHAPDGPAFTRLLEREFAAAEQCGATLLRALAELITAGALPMPDGRAFAGDLRARARQLDDDNAPDFSAFPYDAKRYERDEHGQPVVNVAAWDWRTRVALVKRYHKRQRSFYGEEHLGEWIRRTK